MKNSISKLVLVLLSINLLFIACKKDATETTCIENPLENIDWLKQTHQAFQISMSPQATRIVQYMYQGECVYLIDSCVNCSDGGQTVFNENQETICQFGTIAGLNTCPDFFDQYFYQRFL
jgi:hypothetical protein